MFGIVVVDGRQWAIHERLRCKRSRLACHAGKIRCALIGLSTLATTARVEYQDQRRPPGAEGHPDQRSLTTSAFDYDKPITAQDPNVLDQILKSLNDLKSEVGFIKKHVVPYQPRQTKNQFPKKVVHKGAESTKRTVDFAGVALESITFTPRSLVDRPLTNIDDNDSGQTAFMAMPVVQQPVAKNDF